MGQEILGSSRLEFLEKVLADYFALSDARSNTSRPLNREGKAEHYWQFAKIPDSQVSWK